MERNHTRLRFEVCFFLLTFALIFQFTQTSLGAKKLFSVFERYSDTESGNLTIRTNDFNSITKDGRYVAFATHQKYVISSTVDTNDKSDVFLKDLLTGTIVLVSHINGSLTTAPNAISDAPSISEVHTSGGESVVSVAFRSCATNIMASEGNNGYCHIYVREYNTSDLTGTPDTYIVSKAGSTLATADSDYPKISGNGAYVAFNTTYNFSGDSGGSEDIYRKTLPTGSMELVSHPHTQSSPVPPTVQRSSRVPSINYAGNLICFESDSDNLDPDFPYGDRKYQIYLWTSGASAVSSVSRTGTTGNYAYGDQNSGINGTINNRGCDVSDSGKVAFSSMATNLISQATDSDGASDVFLRDSSISQISIGISLHAVEPNISAAGRFVAFQEQNSSVNLVDVKLNTRRIMAAGAGYPDISETGRFGIFWGSSSLVGASTNVQRPIVHDWVAPAQLNNGDFDSDGVTDLAFFRPSEAKWYVWKSPGYNLGTTSPDTPYSWGSSGDIPAAGDYDRDGKADSALFRPSNGNWYISYSGGGTATVAWGTNGDKPVPADYDGDGKTDLAVYRPSNGNWYIIKSSDSSQATINFGITNDVPVPGDYDKDRKADIAVYRPYETPTEHISERGNWYVYCSGGSSTVCQAGGGGYIIENFGGAQGDKPVQNDYEGDGDTDFAFYRPGSPNSHWFYRYGASDYSDVTWGVSTDIAMPGEYDNDGKADFAVFRRDTGSPEGNGTWYILKSSDFNYYTAVFGKSSDVFVSNANFP